MESLGFHLPPVTPDSYYDVTTHNSSYNPYQTSASSVWPCSRDEAGRCYQPFCNEYDTSVRYTSTCSGRRSCTVVEQSVPEMQEDAIEVSTAEWANEASKDEDRTSDKNSQRQSQVALTLQWLTENYERAEGICLPRCVLYQHYLDFCKKMKFTPAGAATFGKIIRQRFPKLTTRRLGTRGQSKYHYYGIGIKESSVYYHSVYLGKGLTRFSGIKLKTEGSSRKYSVSSKTGTLLPEFPNADNLIIPEDVQLDKMRTFIMMYRTHCQRILDTVISANFEEVQNFLVHFWQGMPEHLVDLLNCEMLDDIIALCDNILYKVLLDVLIPSTIQELPNSLFSEMRLFAKRLPFWLETSMETVPGHIQKRKIEVAKGFILSLKRQSSFVLLAQTTRAVITSQEMVSHMLKDIVSVDFEDICSQAAFLDSSTNPKFCTKLLKFYTEFKELLNKQVPIDGYIEWIDDMVDKCVIKPSDGQTDAFTHKASEFLLQWGAFGGLLMRELTLKNATSFASIHLLHLMLEEYAFLSIETQQEKEIEKFLQTAVQKYMRNSEEIQTKAVVRNASVKAMNSPKSKRKRNAEELSSGISNPLEHKGKIAEIIHQPNENVRGTAFSRPTNTKGIVTVSNAEILKSKLQHGAISVPSVKPYQPYNSDLDRPTYLPQFTIGSYSDFVGANPSFNGRIPSYSESYSQTFSSNPFSANLSPVSGNYWSDGRSHHSLSDPYQSYNYNYNKFNSTYGSLNKTALLRSNAYQDNINRTTYDTSRSYYRGSHDNIQVGPSIPVGTYGANFMDIAPPAGQYCYQDDHFSASMSSSFAKPFLTGPFR